MVALVVPALGSHGQENPCDSLASQACLICELHVLVRDPVSETKIGISKVDLWPPHACNRHTYAQVPGLIL